VREDFEAALRRVFDAEVPHVAALGISVEAFDGRCVVMRLPYGEELVGNPETGVLFGGAVSTLIDTACGMGVIAALETPRIVVTLDLRIDYLRPALSGRDLMVRAECYHVTRHVAFSRALAYHDDRERPVASAQGSFILARDSTRETSGLQPGAVPRDGGGDGR
jgi:uncharacterized protein (TIGR00369 family)